jgi:hypothetical protein
MKPARDIGIAIILALILVVASFVWKHSTSTSSPKIQDQEEVATTSDSNWRKAYSTDLYIGTLEISGTYIYYQSEFDGGIHLCFNPDRNSIDRLPSDYGFFCFSNEDNIVSKFHIVKNRLTGLGCSIVGTSTVIIGNYEAFHGETEGFDKAYLSEVSSTTEPTYQGCR